METRRVAPHDALVRATFSQTEHAAGMLRAVLPSAIAARVDFSTLTLQPGSFVDRALRSRHTDLLFSVRVAGRESRLYLLFEHQSTVEALLALRLLAYMVRIWERHRAAHPRARRVPMIVPVVLHHSRHGWSASVTFEGLLDVDDETLAALGEHAVRMRFVLDDISGASDRTLRGRAMTALGRLVLWCLRHGREPDELLRRLRGLHALIDEVRQAPNGREALEMVWRYILLADTRHPPEDVMARLIEAAGETARKEILSAGEILEKRGATAILLRQLRARFGELPEATLARIHAARPREIERWADRVLTAASLDEVLAAR